MNANHRLKSAVANIQDELHRILAVADVREFEESGAKADFKNQLVKEFNEKLREMKNRNRQLATENKRLRDRLNELENNKRINLPKARALKSEGSILDQAPPKKARKINDSNDEQVMILLSPSNKKTRDPEDFYNSRNENITSSQFNLLPTQYSNNSELPEKSKRQLQEQSLMSSPIKADFIHEDNRIVGDSQDEFDGFDENVRGVPSHYTALQRIDFLRSYYRMKLLSTNYTIKLNTNPITEKDWTLNDFKPNGLWRRPKLHSHAGIMTKAQEKNYRDFFQIAGYGTRVEGPVWESQQDSHTGNEECDVPSQVMDKYLSPPNFMIGSFPDTQEHENQKQMVQKKAQERIMRRIQSATSKPPGEFVFFEDIINQFVAQNRFQVDSI